MLTPVQDQTLQLVNIKHGYFGTHGGVSKTPYDSLNVSFAVGDNDADVHKNLDIIATHIGSTNENLCLVKQTHSTNVISVTSPASRNNRAEADGMVTAIKGLALGIQTADCGPVLFADPKNEIIGGCHAGWKGAVGGIVSNTIDEMIKLGSDRQHIIAVLGPTISVQNYEVGDQFRSDIIAQFAHTEPYFKQPSGATAPHFDLPRCIMDQLESANIADVKNMGICTYANADSFFSHRNATHKNAKTGRQLSVIALF